MLQLNPQPDEKLVEALGEVKDSVGEWHDWVQLVKIAQKVLDPRSDRTILKHIENTGNQKFESALATAMRVRARYFTGGEHHKLNGAVLQMAS